MDVMSVPCSCVRLDVPLEILQPLVDAQRFDYQCPSYCKLKLITEINWEIVGAVIARE